MKWIKVDKDKSRTMPSGIDLWVYNSETEDIEFFRHDQYVPLGVYTHYAVTEKSDKPKL